MRERKETETKKEAKERKRRAQAPEERLGGSPKFPVRPQVHFLHGFGYLGGRQGEVSGACQELFRTMLGEKNGNVEHRPQKGVQEILRGSQYDPKYRFF